MNDDLLRRRQVSSRISYYENRDYYRRYDVMQRCEKHQWQLYSVVINSAPSIPSTPLDLIRLRLSQVDVGNIHFFSNTHV